MIGRCQSQLMRKASDFLEFSNKLNSAIKMGNRRCFRDLKAIIRGLTRARRSYQSQTSETIHCLLIDHRDWW
jgi:hypothetical protein